MSELVGSPAFWIVCGTSTLLAAWLCALLWRSGDLLVIKLLFSVLLFVPVVGPLAYLWIQRFPPPVPPDMQDRPGADHHDSWRERLEQGGKLPKLRRWSDKRGTERGFSDIWIFGALLFVVLSLVALHQGYRASEAGGYPLLSLRTARALWWLWTLWGLGALAVAARYLRDRGESR